MIPLVDVAAQNRALAAELRNAFEEVFASGAFLGGRFLREFEESFAAYCGTPHAIGVASGTAALHLALRAMEIGPGDEVIVPANTFIATAAAVSAVGATVVFADADPSTLLLSPADLERRLTARTKAIIPVHLFGRAQDLDPLLEIASRRGLWVLEDACQAHGAVPPGRGWVEPAGERAGVKPGGGIALEGRPEGSRSGSVGHAGVFSFYPAKNLGALGDAGAVVTRDAALAARVRRLLDHGRSGHFDHPVWGYNFRIDALQAAFLSVKLPHLDSWNASRRVLAGRYRTALADLPVELLAPEAGPEHVHHLFPILTADRDALMAHMKALGIGVSVHYPIPLHLQGAYGDKGHGTGDFPVVERAARMLVSLPIYPEFAGEGLAEVVSSLRRFFEASGRQGVH